MKIPFMMQFPWGGKTKFIEKLWAMFIAETGQISYKSYYLESGKDIGLNINMKNVFTPKLHTIRPASDRFKVDQFVQPFVWTFKPYKKNPNPNIPAQFDFMPPLKIVSKQRFDLKFKNTEFGTKAFICIDGKLLEYESEYEELAVNDGFKNAIEFFRYFDKPLENMEIRHFTSLKY